MVKMAGFFCTCEGADLFQVSLYLGMAIPEQYRFCIHFCPFGQGQRIYLWVIQYFWFGGSGFLREDRTKNGYHHKSCAKNTCLIPENDSVTITVNTQYNVCIGFLSQRYSRFHLVLTGRIG